jgi:EpsI family protein
LAVAVVWPARLAYTEHADSARNGQPIKLALPGAVAPWQKAAAPMEWKPSYSGASVEQRGFYSDGPHTVGVFVEYYRGQEQGRELVNSQNLLCRTKQPDCKITEDSNSRVRLGGAEAAVSQATLVTEQRHWLVWRWYWVGGEYTANDSLAKIYHAKERLLGRPSDEAGIILATAIDGDGEKARQVLQDFADQVLPHIRESLSRAAETGQ